MMANSFEQLVNICTERGVTRDNVNRLLHDTGFPELLEYSQALVRTDYFGVACSFEVSIPEDRIKSWAQAFVAIWMRRGFYVNQSPSTQPQQAGMVGLKLILTKEPLERFNPQGSHGIQSPLTPAEFKEAIQKIKDAQERLKVEDTHSLEEVTEP